MLSTQVETGKISNTVIIIDEPDNSLYPSGSRYLRDELIKMSDKNIVLYSTHSPFMIDRDRIDRHIIVTKNDDITCLKETDNSKYTDDEVLLNAIGTSIFGFLEMNNLLFEGWTDHRIFRVAISKKKPANKSVYERAQNIGVAFVHGASSFKHVTPIVQLARKNVFIFSDSDKAAENARDSYKREKGYQPENWYTIEELGGGKNYTIEDYLESDFLQRGLDQILGEGEKLIADKGNNPVMVFLHNLQKEEKEKLKAYYANNVSISNIIPEYYALLENLFLLIERFSPILV
jgi:hypothetical protein